MVALLNLAIYSLASLGGLSGAIATDANRHHAVALSARDISSRQTTPFAAGCNAQCTSPWNLVIQCGNNVTTACTQICQQANYDALVDCFVCDVDATAIILQQAAVNTYNTQLLGVSKACAGIGIPVQGSTLFFSSTSTSSSTTTSRASTTTTGTTSTTSVTSATTSRSATTSVYITTASATYPSSLTTTSLRQSSSSTSTAGSGGAISTGGDTNSGGTNVAAIAGGVGGGVAALALIGFLLWFCRRRSRRETNAKLGAVDMADNDVVESKIVPFQRADSGPYPGAAAVAYDARSSQQQQQQQPLLGHEGGYPQASPGPAGEYYSNPAPAVATAAFTGQGADGSYRGYQDQYNPYAPYGQGQPGHAYHDSSLAQPQAWPTAIQTGFPVPLPSGPSPSGQSMGSTGSPPPTVSEYASTYPADRKLPQGPGSSSGQYQEQSSNQRAPGTTSPTMSSGSQSASPQQQFSQRLSMSTSVPISEAHQSEVDVYHHQDAGPVGVSKGEEHDDGRERIELPPTYEAANR